MRGSLFQIGRSGVKAETEAADSAYEQSGFDRAHQPQRNVCFAAIQRSPAFLTNELDAEAGMLLAQPHELRSDHRTCKIRRRTDRDLPIKAGPCGLCRADDRKG